MANYLDWNWAGEHVQSEVKNGEYLSSESTLLLAGPSRFVHLNTAGGLTNSIVPLGLISNMSMSQQRGVQRLYEIGSKRAYFVPGRMFANFNMGRIMFYGPSLMRMLYALAPVGANSELGPFGAPLATGAGQPQTPPEYAALFPNTVLASAPGFGGTGTGNDTENRDFFINLASELFNVPFGLIVVYKDTRNRPYGAVYLEECYLETHSMGLDSGSIVIGEQVSGLFDTVTPIQLVSAT
jgi:hypothetical protein